MAEELIVGESQETRLKEKTEKGGLRCGGWGGGSCAQIQHCWWDWTGSHWGFWFSS